jgi:hypothetical protein
MPLLVIDTGKDGGTEGIAGCIAESWWQDIRQRHPICQARAAILRSSFTPRFTLRGALLALLTPSGPAIWRGRVRCAGSPVSSLWLVATTRDAGLPGQWAARSRDRVL